LVKDGEWMKLISKLKATGVIYIEQSISKAIQLISNRESMFSQGITLTRMILAINPFFNAERIE